jgi:hypothetical protein
MDCASSRSMRIATTFPPELSSSFPRQLWPAHGRVDLGRAAGERFLNDRFTDAPIGSGDKNNSTLKG